MTSFFAALRSGDVLDRQRAIVYSGALLAIEAVFFVWFVAWLSGAGSRAYGPSFVSFYAAGTLADAGTPWLAYDPAAHRAAEQAVTGAGADYVVFYYPPTFLLVCAALARLPFVAALLGFGALALPAYLLVTRAVLRERGWAAFVPLLAYPSVLFTVGIGQNSLFSAALLGGATLLLEPRPVVAGVLLGLLCYKPQLALLVPVALAAGAHWRSLGAAALSASGVVALSVALFGRGTWSAFFAAAAHSSEAYLTRVDPAAMVSPFGAVLAAGGPPAAAYALQAATTIAMAAIVAHVWKKRVGIPAKAAALLAATCVSFPIVLLYDLVVAVVAMAWLVRAAAAAAATRASGFLPWEKVVLAAMFFVPLVARRWHLPIAQLGLVLIVAYALSHARREEALTRGPAAAAHSAVRASDGPASGEEGT